MDPNSIASGSPETTTDRPYLLGVGIDRSVEEL
jgi:hypothetical protein